mgnify:FL=1
MVNDVLIESVERCDGMKVIENFIPHILAHSPLIGSLYIMLYSDQDRAEEYGLISYDIFLLDILDDYISENTQYNIRTYKVCREV